MFVPFFLPNSIYFVLAARDTMKADVLCNLQLHHPSAVVTFFLEQKRKVEVREGMILALRFVPLTTTPSENKADGSHSAKFPVTRLGL